MIFWHFLEARIFVYMAARFLRFREWQSRGSKKALLCGDCCDRNQAIILVVLVLLLVVVYPTPSEV